MTDAREPLPIVQASDEDVAAAAYGAGGEPDPATPLGAAALWQTALGMGPDQYRTALENLSFVPNVWGDFSEAVGLISGRSILTRVDTPDGAPHVSYVRFIEYSGASGAVAFADAPLDDVIVMTLVKPPDFPWWLVYSLTRDYAPPVDELELW
ncbi:MULTISPECIES: hypothetical protein [Actinomycetes]|uniref:Uncharacterized protein n=1 Tax=Streptomyces rhizosphaericus TaxID=114699 RepID=A0ABP4DEH4_9ACTN